MSYILALSMTYSLKIFTLHFTVQKLRYYLFWNLTIKTTIMKQLTISLSLTLINLMITLPSFARNIVIPFAKGSYCGMYGGKVDVGDNFVLNLAKEQQLIIQKTTPHDYSVIAPNGNFLEVIQRWDGDSNQYWTGNQSGNFKIKVNSVPQELQIKIQFCAYTGEGAL